MHEGVVFGLVAEREERLPVRCMHMGDHVEAEGDGDHLNEMNDCQSCFWPPKRPDPHIETRSNEPRSPLSCNSTSPSDGQ